MKLLMSILIYVLPWMLMAQTVEQLDFVAPAEGDYAAVQKGTQWGFIDASGQLVVPFRNDLVAYANEATDTDLGVAGQMYPVLLEDRSIVYRIKDGIAYYGFIDATGKVVIAPQYLNVTNFKNGLALVLELEERVLGRNDPLGKRVVSYRYNVALIDREGTVQKYLGGPFPIVLTADKLKEAPPIAAKDVTDHLIAVRQVDNSWSVFAIND